MNAYTKIVARSRWEPSSWVLTAQTSVLKTILHALRNTVISGGDDAVLKDGDGSDTVPRAVGLLANRDRDPHVIGVTVRKFFRCCSHEVSSLVRSSRAACVDLQDPSQTHFSPSPPCPYTVRPAIPLGGEQLY